MKYRKSKTWMKHARIIVHPTTLIIVAFIAIVLFMISPHQSDKLADVSIFVPESGTKVFFDNKKEVITTKDNETVVIKDVTAGAHLILTHKDGYWPWSKAITVEEAENISLSTFGITQSPALANIPKYIKSDLSGENETYTSIMEHLESDKSVSKKYSSDRNTVIESTGQNIIASWKGDPELRPAYFCDEDACSDTITVLPQNREVRNIDFYPGRDDLILFAAENRVYVIELDARDIQNIQPLYESLLGQPEFVRTIDRGVYIKDGDKLYLVTL